MKSTELCSKCDIPKVHSTTQPEAHDFHIRLSLSTTKPSPPFTTPQDPGEIALPTDKQQASNS